MHTWPAVGNEATFNTSNMEATHDAFLTVNTAVKMLTSDSQRRKQNFEELCLDEPERKKFM